MDSTHDIVPIKPDAITPSNATADILDRLASFLRVNVAEGDAAESTIKTYCGHIRNYAAWCAEEGVNAASATEHDLALYRRWLAEEGYARNSIAAKLSAVRRFYEAAIWRGYRDDNPAAGLKPPREHTTTEDRILERYLTPEQVQNLLAAPDIDTDAGKRDLAMMALMYYHGLRVSEVVALTVDHIVLGEPVRILVEQSKGKRSRTLFLIPESNDALLDWMKARYSYVTDETEARVFVSFCVSAPGTPLTPQGIRWVVNGYLKDLGYYREGLSCHALRHAHASHVIAAGGSVMPLAREMGHASPETTNVYTHIVDALKQNPAALLSTRRREEVKDDESSDSDSPPSSGGSGTVSGG